jgi:hypothetical protein
MLFLSIRNKEFSTVCVLGPKEIQILICSYRRNYGRLRDGLNVLLSDFKNVYLILVTMILLKAQVLLPENPISYAFAFNLLLCVVSNENAKMRLYLLEITNDTHPSM